MGIAPVLLLVISVTSPSTTVPVTTPVHFAASAQGAAAWTVTASNGSPLYKTANPALDGWVLLPQGQQTVTVTALDGSGNPLGSAPLALTVQNVAAPAPPTTAQIYDIDSGCWKISLSNIGGKYQEGELLGWQYPPPNPPSKDEGIHFRVVSQPNQAFTDGLIVWTQPRTVAPLNALWTFSFNVPADPTGVAAYESDFVIQASMGGVVRVFNFSGQYAKVPKTQNWQWETWAQQCDGKPPGTCSNWNPVTTIQPGPPFAPTGWHQLTFFYQRVTPAGYQSVPAPGAADPNTSMLYAVAILDGNGMQWNVPANSQVLSFVPQLKLQHQIDTSMGGVTVDKWIVGQTLTTWN